ncbi:MAG: hypothetical protein AVDCRST_MAG89-3990, partial [uncultured Gemmatimonadetes bacterium]
ALSHPRSAAFPSRPPRPLARPGPAHAPGGPRRISHPLGRNGSRRRRAGPSARAERLVAVVGAQHSRAGRPLSPVHPRRHRLRAQPGAGVHAPRRARRRLRPRGVDAGRRGRARAPGRPLHGRADRHSRRRALRRKRPPPGAGGCRRASPPPHAPPRDALCLRGGAAAPLGRSHVPSRDAGRRPFRGAVDGAARPAPHPARRRAAPAGRDRASHADRVGRARHHHPARPRGADAPGHPRRAAPRPSRRLSRAHGGSSGRLQPGAAGVSGGRRGGRV